MLQVSQGGDDGDGDCGDRESCCQRRDDML